MAYKAFSFRLNPTLTQLDQIKQCAGATRWLWNQMLSQNITTYASEGKFIFQFDMNKLATQLREQYEWLNNTALQVLQQKNRDLEVAIKQKISKKSTVGFPKFKRKSDSSDSFRVPQHFKICASGIKLPKIAGWIPCNHPRKLQGKAKSITIKQDGEHWMAVILCEVPDVVQRSSFAESEVVGLDVGLTDFVTTSDGAKIANPKHFSNSERLLKSRQCKLSKKTKGSSNRNKARASVAKLHRKVRNQRKDFQWKTAAEITNQYALVCTEALNIKGMIKNHKLAKHIGAAGWGLFKTKLQHKLQEKGGLLIDVNPRNTSKTCSECGCLHEGKMELSIRSWTCPDCGADHDRDVNAARNIKKLGINRVGTTRIYDGCGDTAGGDSVATESSHVSLKQQNLVSMETDAYRNISSSNMAQCQYINYIW